MNALPCTLPVEVHDQVLHAIWRDTAMFVKGILLHAAGAMWGFPNYDAVEHR